METLIAELPEWARTVFYLVLAIGGGGLFAYSKSRPVQESRSHVEVAGALVDSSSVKALAGSIEGHSLQLVQARSDGREFRSSLDRLAEALDKHGEVVADHLNEVRELRHEMGRRR